MHALLAPVLLGTQGPNAAGALLAALGAAAGYYHVFCRTDARGMMTRECREFFTGLQERAFNSFSAQISATVIC